MAGLIGISAILVLLLSGLLLIGHRANRTDWGRRWINCIEGLNQLYCRHWHRLQHENIELPESGPVLLVSNHISGLDPMMMIAASSRPIHFIIAREEYERPLLKTLFDAVGCIPVERSSNPEKALRQALRVLEQGAIVALFPHGAIHLDSHPPRRLKAGVSWLAQKTACPIIPLKISGIRGAGHVFRPLVLRSEARIRVFPPIYCDDDEHHRDCLQRLEDIMHAEGEKAD